MSARIGVLELGIRFHPIRDLVKRDLILAQIHSFGDGIGGHGERDYSQWKVEQIGKIWTDY
jgi:hypothetical protein